MPSPKPIWIDCDPGIDDAIALLLAIASEPLDIRGISTVAGNVPVAITQANARRICELGQGRSLSVYGGCPRPLLCPPIHAGHVHGNNGLGGVELPEPTMPLQSLHGVQALIQALTQTATPLTLATLGPLTNVAVAMVQVPEMCQQIAEIVIMGGVRGQGNVTPAAEFNFFADPHAAQIVLESGVPITLIGLDVTHQTIATPSRQAQIGAIGNPVSQTVLKMLPSYGQAERYREAFTGPPLHDPCVIAYLLQPELFAVQQGYVAVETASPLNLGRSTIDLYGILQHPANAQVAVDMDTDGFYQLLMAALEKL